MKKIIYKKKYKYIAETKLLSKLKFQQNHNITKSKISIELKRPQN